MLNVTTWDIHTDDGKYVGQSAALHPKTALYLCLLVTKPELAPSAFAEEQPKDGDGHSCRFRCDGECFVVTPLN